MNESLASSAVKTAIELSAVFIVVLTENGEMPRLLAKYRPPISIICISNNTLMAQQSLINRGTIPIIEDINTFDQVVKWVQKYLTGTVVIVSDSNSCNQIIGVTTIEKENLTLE